MVLKDNSVPLEDGEGDVVQRFHRRASSAS